MAAGRQNNQDHDWTGSGPDGGPEQDTDMFCCHRVQDSLLSSDSRFTDYRGILNWIIILLVLTHAHLFLENFIQHGFLVDLRKVLEHLMEDGYNWPSLYLILASNVFVVISFLLEKCLAKGRISLRVGYFFHLVNLVLMMLFPATIILHNDKSVSTGGALLCLCIYTTLCLKLYSYQEANWWYRQEHVTREGNRRHLSQRRGGAEHLNMSDLYYFLLAPTLCFQRDFPRSPKIRINFLLHRLLEMVLLTQLMVGIVQQWIGPIFQRPETSLLNMDVTTRIEHLVELVAPSHFLWLILFFLFSHSCLNFSGELLRFGDRQFYGDWWNAENLKIFWRKWNVPFHKWTHRHLHRPLVQKGVSARHAELLIFILFAAVSEYIVAMSLRTLRFWIFIILILELLVAAFFGRYFNGNYGNGLVWFCLLLGPPLAVMTYFHDHYVSHCGRPPWNLY